VRKRHREVGKPTGLMAMSKTRACRVETTAPPESALLVRKSFGLSLRAVCWYT